MKKPQAKYFTNPIIQVTFDQDDLKKLLGFDNKSEISISNIFLKDNSDVVVELNCHSGLKKSPIPEKWYEY
jgi:hypothetical protein